MQTSNPISAHFTIAGQKLPVTHFTLTEAISAPVELTLSLRLWGPTDSAHWLGKAVVFGIEDEQGTSRTWHLACERASVRLAGSGYAATLKCRSHWAASFYVAQSQRLYCHQYLPQLVESLLGERITCQWHLSHEGWGRTQLLQYAETDGEFIQRICGRENIQWFSRNDSEKEVIHFVDHPRYFIDRDKPLIYTPRETFQNGPGSRLGIYELTCVQRGVLAPNEWDDDFIMRLYSGVPCLEAGRRTEGMSVKPYQPLSYEPSVFEKALKSRHVQSRDYPATGYRALRFESNHIDLAPGMRVDIASQCGVTHAQGIYRLNHVIHQARTSTEGEIMLYHNTVVAQDNASPWRGVMRPIPAMPLVFQAQIQSADDALNLDAKGRETIHNTFDASVPIPRLTPYAHSSGGMQFPLYPGVEVMLTCLHGEPDLPVIVGSVFNDEHPSPVTAVNPHINIIRTHGNQTLIFDDTPATPAISFTTHAGHQWLMRNGETPGFFIECVGGMIMRSHGKQSWYSGKNFQLWAGQTYTQKASVGQLIQTQQGNIAFEAKLDMKLHALRQIELYAKRHKNIFCRYQTVTVMGNQSVTVTDGDAHLTIQGASLVETADNITISSLSGDIVMSNQAGSSGIRLTQSGDIQIYGSLIKINSDIQKHEATINHH